MASHDSNAPVALTAYDFMSLSLGAIALSEALAFLRAGGYEPTEEQLASIARTIKDSTLALPHLVEDMSAVSDEQLEEAARTLGASAVRKVCGVAPRAN